MAHPLEISHLIKDYGSLRAVNDVSFTLEKGEIFGLLGPNGAGKTSVISTIVTIEKPTSGTVKVFGHDVTKEPRPAKSKIGFVPQEIINYGYFNTIEIIEFYAGYFGKKVDRKHLKYIMEQLGIWEHRNKRVRQLSGGMKRRLLIAKALVHEPELLLLDEPTAGVDIELRSSLWDLVRELRNDGMTILLTTHYLEEAEELCDRVGILSLGELKKVGETHGLVKDLTNRDVHLYFDNDLGPMNHPALLRQKENEMVFSLPSSKNLGEFLSELKIDLNCIKDIRIQEGNLEDAFREVLGVKSR